MDLVGVELGGALKNPLAIAAGLIEGKGLGINTMAAFVTRSSQELQALARAMGGHELTVSGLSGVGDLMLTSFGDPSRNRTCGMRLVAGETMEQICATTTVEGVPTAQVAVHFADMCDLDLPIFRTIAAVLRGDMTPDEGMQSLLSRPVGQGRRGTPTPGLPPARQ